MGSKRKRPEAMDDEDNNDFHLVGTDGEEVPCCKAALARISPMFKAMFCGGFREEKTDRCSLDFHSVVITLIVKFCNSGVLDLGLISRKKVSLEEEASLLVGLREAGRYFEIDDIFSAAEAKIGNLVFQRNVDKTHCQYASAFFTELTKRGEDTQGPLWLILCNFTTKNMMECFSPTAPENADTSHTRTRVLATVLQETRNTLAAVRWLQTWYSLETNSAGSGYCDEEKRALIKVAENINLNTLHPSLLSKIKPCPLFSSERILEAFVHQFKSPETPKRSRPTPFMHVFGAGMEYLNTIYRPRNFRSSYPVDIFFHHVEHRDNKCLAVIHRRRKEGKWFISITNNRELDDYAVEIREKSIWLHVYESSCNSVEPPFSGWKSCKGTGPVPNVGWINTFQAD